MAALYIIGILAYSGSAPVLTGYSFSPADAHISRDTRLQRLRSGLAGYSLKAATLHVHGILLACGWRSHTTGCSGTTAPLCFCGILFADGYAHPIRDTRHERLRSSAPGYSFDAARSHCTGYSYLSAPLALPLLLIASFAIAPGAASAARRGGSPRTPAGPGA